MCNNNECVARVALNSVNGDAIRHRANRSSQEALVSLIMNEQGAKLFREHISLGLETEIDWRNVTGPVEEGNIV